MAGGKGTRLGHLTERLPKALLPMGQSTLLGRLLDQLGAQGATEFVLCIGPEAQRPVFEAAIGRAWRGIPVRMVSETAPLGTVGCLGLVPELAADFVVVNCDIVTALDFVGLYRDHLASGAAATVATRTWSERLRFGVVQMDETGRITRVREKPETRHEIMMGASALNRDRVAQVLPDRPVRMDMPDLLTALIAAGHEVRRFHSLADWQDVGTPADYALAQERIRGGS